LLTVVGAVAVASCFVLVILGMAHRRTQGAAAEQESHIAASYVNMFEDTFKPTAFTMQQWTELRDNLFYGGRTHREDTSHACHALFKIAKALNLIQQHYVFRPGPPDAGLTVVGLKGRLLAEVSVKFLLGPNELKKLPARADLQCMIDALRNAGINDRELVKDLHTLRKLGNGPAHDNDELKPSFKAHVADAAFRVSLKIWTSAAGRFPEVVREAETQASAIAIRQKVLKERARLQQQQQWAADEAARLQREAEARSLQEAEAARRERQAQRQCDKEERSKQQLEERARQEQRKAEVASVLIWALLAIPYWAGIFLISTITGGATDNEDDEERPTICGCTMELLENSDSCDCGEEDGENNCGGVCLRVVVLGGGLLAELVVEILVRMAFAAGHAIALQPALLQSVRQCMGARAEGGDEEDEPLLRT
jgi:hypothetical protein